jgi:glucose-1-phosphate cytidylyltransferase
MDNMKVVILCGGMGTRLKEETEFRPKPLIEIGNRPILWHIMKIYSYYGFNDFILCLGYKGNHFKNYFVNYEAMVNDFTLNLKSNNMQLLSQNQEEWNITFAETGLKTSTGGRLKLVEKYIEDDRFMVTYGDGLGKINITDLIKFHKLKQKTATITGVHPSSKYGIIKQSEDSIITEFSEKPKLDDVINGGFFVFEKEIFDYLEFDKMMVDQPFRKLAKENKMAVFQHDGFWHPLDTHKDYTILNELWRINPEWKVWSD